MSNGRDTLDDVEAEILRLRASNHEIRNALAVEREARLAFQSDLVGSSGNNGKIGSLRGTLGTIRNVVAAVALVALGGAGAAAGAVYSLGDEDGAERIRLEQLERQVQANTETLRVLSIAAEVMRLRLGGEP